MFKKCPQKIKILGQMIQIPHVSCVHILSHSCGDFEIQKHAKTSKHPISFSFALWGEFCSSVSQEIGYFIRVKLKNAGEGRMIFGANPSP